MSIATEIARLQQAKADLKTAINAKGRAITDEPIDQYAAEVDLIEVGGGTPAVTHEVRYIDIDGTILSTQQIESGEDATPPTNPTRAGLTFQQWNASSLNIIKPRDIGAIYITADGKTRIFHTVTLVTGYAFTLYLVKSNTATLTVDWGDGTTQAFTTSGLFNTGEHTYATVGDFEITLWISSGSGTYTLGNRTSSTGVFGASTNHTGITKIWFGENVNEVAAYLAIHSHCITEISIPYGVTTLGAYCFYRMYALKTINLPKGITAMGMSPFYYIYIEYISLPDDITSTPDYFFGYCKSLKKVVLPDSITTLATTTFTGCNALEELYLPNGITSIPSSMCNDCFSLKALSIPATVTDFAGGNNFRNCYALQELNLPAGLQGDIPQGAFNGCSALDAISIPAGITNIGSQAFLNCFSLKTVLVSNEITIIDLGAFENCVSLRDFVLPTSISAFSSNVFRECGYLAESLTIPAGLQAIPADVFYNCKSIRKFIILKTGGVLSLQSTSAFSGISKICKIYVPDALVETYKTATNWVTYANYIYPISSM